MSHKIITIAREFGSGGYAVGEKLSEILGIPLYDRDLVEMAADKMHHPSEEIQVVDEVALNSFLSAYKPPRVHNAVNGYGLTLNDSTYLAQTAIIESLAQKGPCIIIGRCSDYILRNDPDVINVFVGASFEDRTKRVMELYDMTEKEAVSKIKSMDISRKNYYEYYTNKKWADLNSYQLMLNISLLGIDQAADIIKTMYEA